MNKLNPWKLTSDTQQSMLIIWALLNTFYSAANVKYLIIALK